MMMTNDPAVLGLTHTYIENLAINLYAIIGENTSIDTIEACIKDCIKEHPLTIDCDWTAPAHADADICQLRMVWVKGTGFHSDTVITNVVDNKVLSTVVNPTPRELLFEPGSKWIDSNDETVWVHHNGKLKTGEVWTNAVTYVDSTGELLHTIPRELFAETFTRNRD